jgi:hypothetical protein
MRRIFKFCIKISWKAPWLIPTVSASSWIVRQRSSLMSSQIYSTFSVVLLVLGRPQLLSFSTDARPALKRECHSETAIPLKEYSPKASRTIWRVCRLVARFCHPSQTKRNMKSNKHSCKNNAYSQFGVMEQTGGICFRKRDLGLPSNLLSLRQLMKIRVWELSDTTSYIVREWYNVLK